MPKFETIVDAFFSSASKHEDQIAIEIDDGESITYKSLATKIEGIAGRHRDLRQDIISICLPRSIEMVAQLIGIWAAGKTALVLDPEWPKARIDQIIGEAGDTVSAAAAYLIYTSGSTGSPKGVLVGHGGLVPLLREQIEVFQLHSGDRNYWMNGVAFDASISDIGSTLLSGATLCIDRQIDHSQLLDRWRNRLITHVDLPPALLPMLDANQAPESLQTIVIGGMVAKPAAIRNWVEKVRVVNVYGPTEATICTSMIVCDSNWSRPLIGDPVQGMAYSINPESGELQITGPGVALGYHRNESLSKQRFSEGAFFTRDRVKQHHNGDIEFIGRLDRQLKVHGKLVCPEELELSLLEHSMVDQCRVYETSEGTLGVDIYGVLELKKEILVQYLSEKFPTWMIPRHWVIGNESLTFNPTSYKLDNSSLVHQWLRRANLPLITNLDELDSLDLIRFFIEAKKDGVELNPETIASYPTVERIETAIRKGTLHEGGISTDELMQSIAHISIPTQGDFEPIDSRHFFVTGATGILGSHLLPELLKAHPNATFTCFTRNEPTIADDRVSYLIGDIRELNWTLPETIDGIIHCAADTSFAKTFDQLYPVNVAPVAKLLDHAYQQRMQFHYVSTLAVFVDALPLPSICNENDLLEDTEMVFGGYAQSKWVAEKLIHRYQKQVATWIYRPGLLVTGNDDCRISGEPNNDFKGTCDYTPVQFAATRIAQLSTAACPGIYHITSGKKKGFVDLTNSVLDPTPWMDSAQSPLRLFKTTHTTFSTKEADHAVTS